MRQISYYLILGLFAIVFFGCDTTGPQGPMGPRGPEGPQGVQGPAGSGFAATVFTTQFTTADIKLDAEDGKLAYVDFDVPELTESVVDNGIVLAYIDSQKLDQWVAMPFVISYDDTQNENDPNVDETVMVTYAYTYNLFSIVYTSSFDPVLIDDLPTGPCKVVLIPGTVASKMSKEKSLNLKDYNAVMEFLQLNP